MRTYGRQDSEKIPEKKMDKNIALGIEESLSFIPKDGDNNPWDFSERLLTALQTAILLKKPFSMVRIGDGEGRILGYPLFYNNKQIADQVLTYQFGGDVIGELAERHRSAPIFHGIMELKYGILNSIENADILGVPSWLHFRVVNEENKNAMLAQACCFLCAKPQIFGKDSYFDHYIFRRFQEDGHFHLLLQNLEFVGIISHTDKSELLAEKFNIKKLVHYAIPGHQTYMKSEKLHFPTFYKKLIRDIEVPYEGAVFLVAAGYLGKIYCNEIKRKGGIAIDIGAIFDAWTGIGRDNETKNTHLRL